MVSPASRADEADEPTYQIDIPPLNAADALNRLAEQTDSIMLFPYDVAAIRQANEVVGRYTVLEALERLLRGTGLSGGLSEKRVINIAADDDVRSSEEEDMKKGEPTLGRRLTATLMSVFMASAASAQDDSDTDTDSDRMIDEIVVTGSNIRGAIPDSSPLEIYDAEYIQGTGVSTVNQFVETLPQNLGSVNSTAVGSSAGEFNATAVNAIDLRGLGVGATLVLLNGRRLALSSGGRAPDVSLLPLGAIERVEVLTDGASAIYGSDAIAGVVNFVLKDRMEGSQAQTVLGYGQVTSGGHEALRFEQNLGLSWDAGHVLLGYSFFDQTELDARDRPFADVEGPYTLMPEDRRHNGLLTFEHQVGDSWKLFGDLLLSKRDAGTGITRRHPSGTFTIFQERDTSQEQQFANLGVRFDPWETVGGELLASYSNVDTELQGVEDFLSERATFSRQSTAPTIDITAKIDGDLFQVSAGTVRFSLGAGYTEDKFKSPATGDLSRDTNYLFGELLVPVVAQEMGIPGLRRLELHLAGRHTDYSDFGAETSPKIGLVWSPVGGLDLRATYGESFRAPTLNQMRAGSTEYLIARPTELGFADFWSDTDSSVLLFVQGVANPNLSPEQAESFTVGFDLVPDRMPRLKLSATYFSIEYSERVAEGDPTGGFEALTSPEDFSDLYEENPDIETVRQLISGAVNFFNTMPIDPHDPAAVSDTATVVLDNRLRNLSISELEGIDLGASYGLETPMGNITIGVQASHVLDFTDRITRNAPESSVVGTVFKPSDLRMRGTLGLVRGPVMGQLTIQYVDGYKNPFSAANPAVSSWTTADLNLSYELENDLRLSLNVRNIFDNDPPFVALGDLTNQGLTEPLGFDPANANPTGRFANVQLTKGW